MTLRNMKAKRNSHIRARMKRKPDRSSQHSEVRVIVANGIDVSDLGITIDPGAPRPGTKKRRFRRPKINPNLL